MKSIAVKSAALFLSATVLVACSTAEQDEDASSSITPTIAATGDGTSPQTDPSINSESEAVDEQDADLENKDSTSNAREENESSINEGEGIEGAEDLDEPRFREFDVNATYRVEIHHYGRTTPARDGYDTARQIDDAMALNETGATRQLSAAEVAEVNEAVEALLDAPHQATPMCTEEEFYTLNIVQGDLSYRQSLTRPCHAGNEFELVDLKFDVAGAE